MPCETSVFSLFSELFAGIYLLCRDLVGTAQIFLLNSRLKEVAEPARMSFLRQSKGNSTHSELLAAPHPGLTDP